MVYSMTGYGKGNAVLNGKDITVEIKSVNHRYFEYSGRIPRFFAFLDDKIKKETAREISRGKVEVALTVRPVDRTDVTIQADVPLAKSYYNALSDIADGLGLSDEIKVIDLAKYEGVLVPSKDEEDTQQLWEDVKSVLLIAIYEFKTMRAVEGEKLKQDVLLRLDLVENMTKEIEVVAPLRTEKYREKLYNRLQTILQDRQIDDARILTEAALFADKTAVDEEITRLNSHIQQFRQILNADVSQGRKLDFLTQELNRETNTIGSKSNDVEVTRIVVDMKSEIEKVREQIQNIE